MGDKMIGRLQPDTQIDNLNLYKDDILEADLSYAETLGAYNNVSHSDGFVQAGSLYAFEDTTNTPFTGSHEDYFIVVTGSVNGNDGAYQIAQVTNSGKVVLRTYFAAAETGLSYKIYRNPSLEDDINYVITQLSNIIGDTGSGKNWYNSLAKGLNAANTDASNTKNEVIDLATLANNWYGSKTKIVRNLIFSSQSVANSADGKLISTSKPYATPANRTGGSVGALPIFKSVANLGTYHDEGAINAICKVNVINEATGDEFFNAAGYVVFGKIYDGADYHIGDGLSAYIKFFQDDGSNMGLGSEYTWASTDPSSVRFEIPVRKRRRDILEYEEDSQFAGGTLGDAETAQDISEIRDALGLADGEKAGGWDLTNTTNYFPFSELNLLTATLEDIVNKLNEEIGNRTYTTNNIITDGETITESLDKLDIAIGTGFKSKIVERVAATITKNTQHTIPFASGSNATIASYRNDLTFGTYMDIFVNGQKLIPHIGSNNPGHYVEVDDGAGIGTKIIFKFNISANQTIEYVIKDDAI